MMEANSEFRRFAELFLELDGGLLSPRQEATEACVAALFDRILNPPLLDNEDLLLEDIAAASRIIIDLVEREAARLRELISKLE